MYLQLPPKKHLSNALAPKSARHLTNYTTARQAFERVENPWYCLPIPPLGFRSKIDSCHANAQDPEKYC